jgi:hypothetical protein
MPIKPPVDPRFELAKKEVIQLVEEFPGQLDFYDVVTMVPKRSKVYKGEAKCALVHMINNGILHEAPNRTISVAEKD